MATGSASLIDSLADRCRPAGPGDHLLLTALILPAALAALLALTSALIGSVALLALPATTLILLVALALTTLLLTGLALPVQIVLVHLKSSVGCLPLKANQLAVQTFPKWQQLHS